MGYLEKRVPHRTDVKKTVSARVSGVVIAALNDASKDEDILGYSFTVSKIIEKALNDTLAELREKTFIDYYKLVDWKREMERLQTELSYDGLSIFYDFNNELEKIKRDTVVEGQKTDYDLFNDNLMGLQSEIYEKWNNNMKEQGIDLALSLPVTHFPSPYDIFIPSKVNFNNSK